MQDFLTYLQKEIAAHYKVRGVPSVAQIKEMITYYEQKNKCVLKILKAKPEVENQ